MLHCIDVIIFTVCQNWHKELCINLKTIYDKEYSIKGIPIKHLLHSLKIKTKRKSTEDRGSRLNPY